MAGLGTGAGPPVVNVYHEKSRILPDVSRVLACLYEKDVKFEAIKASYKDLLSLQASRSVPVPFYDGPVFLQDSRAICRYIAETYEHQGYPFLLGKDVLERASIEQWLRHEEHAFDPPSRALFCHLAFPPQYEDDDDHEDVNQEMRNLEDVLEVYEQRLGETEFLAGNKFTLADLVHLPGTHHVITSERFAYLYDSRKNVQRWWNEISARDSWQQVLRDMKNVEEQQELEKQQELEEQQKQQLLTTPSPSFGGRDIHIDPRKQEGTKSQTVLVAPPRTGTVSASIPPASQDRGTTPDQKPSSPNQGKQGGFFTTTEQPPTPSRQTESTTQKSPSSSDNFSKSTFFTPPSTPSKTDSSSRKTSQRSPKEAHDKPHLSDFFKDSGRKDEAGTLAKPSSQDSKIPRDSEASDVVSSKPNGPSPHVEKPVPLTYTTPDTQTPQTSYVKPMEQGGTDTSVGTEPGQKLKSGVRPVHTPSKVLHDREKQTAMIPDSGKSEGSPSPDMRAPYAPVTDEERSTILPPKGRTATTGEEKSPPNQQVPRAAPGTDKFSKTAGVNTGAPQGTTPKALNDDRNGSTSVHGADPNTIVTNDEPSEKSSTMSKKVLEATPRKTPSAENHGTSAPVEEVTLDDRVKQGTAGRGEILDVQGSGHGDTSKKPVVDKRAAEPSSQQTTESDKGAVHTLQGITGDESTKAAQPAPEQAPASSEEVTLDARVKQGTAGRGEILDVQGSGHGDTSKKPVVDKRAAEPSSQQTTESDKGAVHTLQGIAGDESTKAAQPAPEQAPASSEQNMPTVGSGGTLDTNGKEAITPSAGDPRGTIPATQRPLASGIVSAQSPELPLSDKRNEKTIIAETSQTRTEAPNENLDRQIPRNAGEYSTGTSPVKSQEHVNETYKEQNDQSMAKLAENRMRQGNDVASNAKTGKREEDDYIANAKNNNNRRAQATTTDAPSKLQIESVTNKPETSNDDGMGINETAKPRIFETSREVQPSSPEKSMGQKQLQENKPATSLQGNVKKNTDAPPVSSGTEQQKKDDLPTEEDINNGKAPEVR